MKVIDKIRGFDYDCIKCKNYIEKGLTCKLQLDSFSYDHMFITLLQSNNKRKKYTKIDLVPDYYCEDYELKNENN